MKREEFERKLKAYAAAAAGVVAAAPAGVMLSASPAEAAIQYFNPSDITVNSSSTRADIDINGDGVPDFSITYSFADSTNFGLFLHWTRTTGGLGGSSFIATGNNGWPSTYVVNLSANFLIQNNLQNYVWNSQTAFLNGFLNDQSSGSFINDTGCIGVRFNTASGVRYGWIRYQGVGDDTGIIQDWAYEDTGAPIQCFDTGQQTTAVPTLNQWGLLAMIGLLAGGGALALRRREAEE